MMDKQFLLNDEQMRRFIVNGYITVKANLPANFHEAIFRQTQIVFEKEGNPGNNVLPRIPAIQEIFDDATVHGALTSVLGPNYYMHPHRHCHYNPPGSGGQTMHKDSWTRRRHHTRWVMALYYPQDTTEEIGPTGILPGSQYNNTQPERDEIPLCGEAGTVTIVHYDLWHRAMPNRSEKQRYMMKFLFTRMEEPQYPSWNSQREAWETVGGNGNQQMWRHLWNWHYGKNGGTKKEGPSHDKSISEWMETLRNESEAVCLNAAYALGEIGVPAIPALMEALQDESEANRRNASYALSAMGKSAIPALMEAASDQNAGVRASAVDTLGDIGLPAQEAIAVLNPALRDASEQVRRLAAEALGTTGQFTSSAVPALIEALGDKDDWVRRNATLALARIGPVAKSAVSALNAALKDDNRYVRANAGYALHRIGTPEASDAVLRFLMTSRWCPSTTRESTF